MKDSNLGLRDRVATFQYWPHIAALVIAGLAFGGYRYFAYYFTRTNDAYVSANIINMAPIVSGTISQIYVRENQSVKEGEMLFEIDPLPYRYAVDQAAAKLNKTRANDERNRYAVKVAEEKLRQSQDRLNLGKTHLRRYQRLLAKGEISETKVLNLEANLKRQQSAVVAASLALRSAQKNLDNNAFLAAKANYDKAKYLLDHTIVVAPADGYITNFNLNRGQYVKEGAPLFALVETKHWWIVTRYRETALRLIKPGDKATITLDMYPGKVFHGHVESIGWGINRVQSGNVAPSTLAYLEATEDWIKISQRFPVRIDIDDVSPDYPLRIGASAVTRTYS